MIEKKYLKKSGHNISFLDFTDFMRVPCGTIIKNENMSKIELNDFIKTACKDQSRKRSEKSPQEFLLKKLNQKHTNIVKIASDTLSEPADGIYTDQANHILIIKTADCFPLFLSDGQTVSLLHLGWRSVLSGILNTFFSSGIDFNLNRARAVIGPGIEKCCFEVSGEVALLFDRKYRRRHEQKYFVDLERLILDELTAFGIKYVLTSKSCTVCESEYFSSYRREGATAKHMLSYISLGG